VCLDTVCIIDRVPAVPLSGGLPSSTSRQSKPSSPAGSRLLGRADSGRINQPPASHGGAKLNAANLLGGGTLTSAKMIQRNHSPCVCRPGSSFPSFYTFELTALSKLESANLRRPTVGQAHAANLPGGGTAYVRKSGSTKPFSLCLPTREQLKYTVIPFYTFDHTSVSKLPLRVTASCLNLFTLRCSSCDQGSPNARNSRHSTMLSPNFRTCSACTLK
jgi:hypothetical protein